MRFLNDKNSSSICSINFFISTISVEQKSNFSSAIICLGSSSFRSLPGIAPSKTSTVLRKTLERCLDEYFAGENSLDKSSSAVILLDCCGSVSLALLLGETVSLELDDKWDHREVGLLLFVVVVSRGEVASKFSLGHVFDSGIFLGISRAAGFLRGEVVCKGLTGFRLLLQLDAVAAIMKILSQSDFVLLYITFLVVYRAVLGPKVFFFCICF